MRVSELAQKAGLTAINEFRDREVGNVYISDMVSDILTAAKPNSVLITLQTHKGLIAAANLANLAMIVIAKNRKPADDVVELATKVGLGLFSSSEDTWAVAKKLVALGF